MMHRQPELLPADKAHGHFSSPFSRISELQIPTGNQLCRQLLLTGILRELNSNDDRRWACWVANTPVKTLLSDSLRKSGHHLLQVLARDSDELVPLAIRALSSGRSHTVVLMLDRALSQAQHAQLEQAAQKGEADCLLICG